MSAASKLLEQLAEEGVALGRSAIRWLENRFAVEDTPENVARAREQANIQSSARDFAYDTRDNPEAWQAYAPYFEGYAIGGRVDPDRCFCRHPLSAKR